MSSLLRPAYVAIGSNLQEPRTQVQRAMAAIARHTGLRVERRSRLYLSSPLGPQDQPHFVNAAVGLLTELTARELLDALLLMERAMGRERRERWGPRIIDLDLIWMVGEPIDEAGLCLPHPGVPARNFVLYPLADIAPTLRIPGIGCVSDLMHRVGDAGLSVLEDVGDSS